MRLIPAEGMVGLEAPQLIHLILPISGADILPASIININLKDGCVTVEKLDDLTYVPLAETTTPTAEDSVGKVYTKSDNKLYFQDGAGSEHEVSLAT